MTFLNPLALALSFLAIPIVLMYILKLRRQEHTVSSTMLWLRAVEDVQANAPWQRLRPNLLLLLQLLALAALILALARPAYTRARTFDGDLIVIIDQSYGMQAHDVAPSRFEAALARARALTKDLGGGNVMSVIGMGAQPQLAIAESADRTAIEGAIDHLRAAAQEPNFLAALSLANSLARGGAKTRAVVLTSRNSGIANLPLAVPFPVEIIRIGGQLHDLGLTAFHAARSGSHVQAVLRVSNFGSHPAHSDLHLSADGQLIDVRPLTVPAGTVRNVFWTNLPAAAQQLAAHLTVHDDVTGDKSAWAVVPGSSTRRVLLVSHGDYFLQTALTLDPSIQLTAVKPAAYVPALAHLYDLVVFDGFLPQAAPASPTLLVGPPRGHLGALRVGVLHRVGALESVPGGSLADLTRYVNLSDVHVASARDLSLPGWLQPVVTSGGTPLLAAGENGGSRLAVIAFALHESDWPLRVSFPVVLQNLLHYLTPGSIVGSDSLLTGEPLTLFAPSGTRQIDITRPDGVIDHLRHPFVPFTDTTQPGIYGVHARGQSNSYTSFAVNFFPAHPAPVTGPPVLNLGHAAPDKTKTSPIPVSIAWAFGLLALAVLTGEWWRAFRR